MLNFNQSSKIFQDSVHGIIEVGPVFQRIIDTPEFQRLRGLNQLGLARYVYPACTHTRFEHSLGAYHLAKRLSEAINSDENSPVKLSKSEALAVQIAALCHDLGHGPFSHTWEKFLRKGGEQYGKFEHEEMSRIILRRIVSKDEVLQEMLRESNVNLELVCDLIRGHPSPDVETQIGNRKFLFEIVSNAKNGNDVDKWDYIMRDCQSAGFGQGSSIIELERLLCFYRPALDPADGAWHMAFRASERENVLRIFSQRLNLHRRVYSHKTIRALEVMYFDIFNVLDPIFKLRELSLRAVNGDETSLSEYIHLDEHSLWTMATTTKKFFGQLCKCSPEMTENMRKCDLLCQRIQYRHLYSVVGRFDINKKPVKRCQVCSRCKAASSSDDRLFLDSTFAEAENRIMNSLDAKVVGDEDKILGEIFAKLPPNSPVRSVNELRLIMSSQATNSTDGPPIFYAYNRLPEAYSFSYAYVKLYACYVLWIGPIQEDVEFNSLSRGPPAVPKCLTLAFEEWKAEKMTASHCNCKKICQGRKKKERIN